MWPSPACLTSPARGWFIQSDRHASARWQVRTGQVGEIPPTLSTCCMSASFSGIRDTSGHGSADVAFVDCVFQGGEPDPAEVDAFNGHSLVSGKRYKEKELGGGQGGGEHCIRWREEKLL